MKIGGQVLINQFFYLRPVTTLKTSNGKKHFTGHNDISS